MYPPLFGPYVWDLLLSMATYYPLNPSDEQQLTTSTFITYLMRVLPCPGCSSHAISFVADNPPRVGNSEEFVQWVVDFHNFVNAKLKKPQFTVLEAKRAFILRHAAQLKDLPRAQQIREEDNLRIKSLQDQLARTVTNNDSNNNETLYFWIMIGVSVFAFFLLLLFIIVGVKKVRIEHQYTKLLHKQHVQQPMKG